MHWANDDHVNTQVRDFKTSWCLTMTYVKSLYNEALQSYTKVHEHEFVKQYPVRTACASLGQNPADTQLVPKTFSRQSFQDAQNVDSDDVHKTWYVDAMETSPLGVLKTTLWTSFELTCERLAKSVLTFLVQVCDRREEYPVYVTRVTSWCSPLISVNDISFSNRYWWMLQLPLSELGGVRRFCE